MRKKKTIFILLFLLIVILSTAYREVAARTYGYSIKSIDDGHIYFGPFGAELTEADSDTLVGLKHKAMFYEKIQVPKQPLDDRSAAKLGIRTIKIISVLSVVASVFPNIRIGAVIAAIYPLLVGLVYLIQCKRAGHGTGDPVCKQISNYLEVSALFTVLWSYSKLRIMNFGQVSQELIFIGGLFLFLFVPSILYLKDSLNRKIVVSLMAAIGVYSVLSIYSWNYAATSGYVDDTIAEVEHRYYRGGGRRGLNKYELTVKMPDETRMVLVVESSVYRSAENGDYVMLRQYKSLFGLDYFIVYEIAQGQEVEEYEWFLYSAVLMGVL